MTAAVGLLLGALGVPAAQAGDPAAEVRRGLRAYRRSVIESEEKP